MPSLRFLLLYLSGGFDVDTLDKLSQSAHIGLTYVCVFFFPEGFFASPFLCWFYPSYFSLVLISGYKRPHTNSKRSKKTIQFRYMQMIAEQSLTQNQKYFSLIQKFPPHPAHTHKPFCSHESSLYILPG